MPPPACWVRPLPSSAPVDLLAGCQNPCLFYTARPHKQAAWSLRLGSEAALLVCVLFP